MTLRVRMTWLFMLVVGAVVVAGCGGSASTGEVSSDAVRNTARGFAGPDGKLSVGGLLVQYVGDEKIRPMTMVVACKPAGGSCEIVAPDGAAYSDLQAFVDDTKLLKPGDTVSGNVNMASPGEPDRTEEFTKRADQPWSWASYAVGGAVLLALLIVAVWLVRTRRRRNKQEFSPVPEAPEDSE